MLTDQKFAALCHDRCTTFQNLDRLSPWPVVDNMPQEVDIGTRHGRGFEKVQVGILHTSTVKIGKVVSEILIISLLSSRQWGQRTF